MHAGYSAFLRFAESPLYYTTSKSSDLWSISPSTLL